MKKPSNPKRTKPNKKGPANIKELNESMKAFREGINTKVELPDRPRIKYLTGYDLVELAEKVEQAFEDGFMLYDTVKQLDDYNSEGDFIGKFFIQTVMKRMV